MYVSPFIYRKLPLTKHRGYSEFTRWDDSCKKTLDFLTVAPNCSHTNS
jgi:hypothetical protein